MKRILITIANILLLVALFLTMTKGFSIKSFQVLSFRELKEASDGLETKIKDVNKEANEYKKSLNTIQQETQKLTKAKKDYLDLVSVSSASEIQEALQTKTYTIEYLWSKVGNYATKEGVNVTMSIASSTLNAEGYKNLNFTVSGEYFAINQFIRDIENDSNLDFTIDSFGMTASQATFVIKNVKIQQEASDKITTQTTNGTSPLTTNNSANQVDNNTTSNK